MTKIELVQSQFYLFSTRLWTLRRTATQSRGGGAFDGGSLDHYIPSAQWPEYVVGEYMGRSSGDMRSFYVRHHEPFRDAIAGAGLSIETDLVMLFPVLFVVHSAAVLAEFPDFEDEDDDAYVS